MPNIASLSGDIEALALLTWFGEGLDNFGELLYAISQAETLEDAKSMAFVGATAAASALVKIDRDIKKLEANIIEAASN